MTFSDAATNLILLLTAAFALLGIDLVFYLRGKTTFSESVWTVNKFTLALAFGAGVICGHLFSVPG